MSNFIDYLNDNIGFVDLKSLLDDTTSYVEMDKEDEICPVKIYIEKNESKKEITMRFG